MRKLRKRNVLATLSASVLALPFLLPAPAASAHGFISGPESRSAYCYDGTVQDCGDIQWEPQSVEGPKGYPAGGPPDGQLCAGADERWAPLDDPRGGQWPTTRLTSGSRFAFTWEIQANHSTTSFRYYVTKPTWNPATPITRAQIESTPFLNVPYHGAQPGTHEVHTGTLPTGRTGRAVIFAVWTIDDTDNAFYSCSDVTF
ncbi:lytic polysaccharide monooxygenase auxiliary activity family 9 protein [Embleya hyalina]|uniref:Chitin-binding protein n=1 Tax=Embleya hyalina TaxID=516124 RepID=A0A401YEY4_9ACTN|nr:lytic polysaccharide monooxygenase auxiliary activity family 9 protein [Embleya hyalina]GCD93171.1 chitin-binding protein [Embleya hyalina]